MTLGTGCATILKPTGVPQIVPETLTLQWTIDSDANNNSVVTVDVVTARDKAVVQQLEGMEAAQWFQKKADLARTNRGKGFNIETFQFVPGSIVPDQKVASKLGDAGIVMFADYPSKGAHRATLPGRGRVQVELGADDFIVHLPRKFPTGLPTAPDLPGATNLPSFPSMPS